MRSSNPRRSGVFMVSFTWNPSMRNTISGGGGIIYQEYPILCDFDNKIFTLDPALAPQIYLSHTMCMKTK